MTLPTTKTVRTPSTVQQRQADDARTVRTLAGGTKAMRSAGKLYLPQENGESDKSYADRLARTVLFNATGKTIDDMTGKVFQKPVILKDNVPSEIVADAENIDLAGRHLNVFARDIFHDAMHSGIGYILVDMPERDDSVRTVADEKQAGIRPYLKYIPVERLIGWRSEMIAGVETLTQVRILESVFEPDGQFDEKAIEQVRVIEPGKWAIWRKNENAVAGAADEWTKVKEGTTSLNKITLVPFYVRRTGFMTGAPPLDKLADLNVTHWQSSSDQRNILHIARVPILFYAGAPEDAQIIVGASSATFNSDPNAKLSYVEHSGAAINAGREDIKDLEFQMQVMGLQLLVPNPGQTATGEVRDDAKENSPLAMMARSLGDALEMAFGFMAEYRGLGTDKGGEVEVNTDFGIQAGAASDIASILSAYSAGLISRETAWAELSRRGLLSDSFDADVEAARIATEAPKLDAGSGRGMNVDA